MRSESQHILVLAVLQRLGRAILIIHNVKRSLGKASPRCAGMLKGRWHNDHYVFMARAVSSLEQNTSARRGKPFIRAGAGPARTSPRPQTCSLPLRANR